MNRNTLIALVIFVALAAGAYFVMKRPDKGVRVGERPTVMAKIEVKKIKKLTITNKGKTVVLQRAGKDGWELVDPVKYAADKYAADSAAEKVEKLEFGDLVTEQQAKHAVYEVDDKSGLRVIVSDGKKNLADFYLGKVVDDHTMFRLAGKKEVHQVVGSQKYAFEREVKNWRKREIIEFKQDQARKLELSSAEGAITLSRKDQKGPWKVDQTATKIDQLDDSAVTDILSSLYSLSAHEFADGKKLGETGLDKPVATIRVTLADGKSQTLLIGGHKGENYWVKRAAAPQIFVIQKHTIKNLHKRPIDFRNKTVLAFKEADVVSLLVTKKEKDKEAQKLKLERKGTDWMGNGKKVKDDQKIKDALKELATLKAEGFARHTAAELGLDKPGCTVQITLKDRTTHLLTAGSVEKDGSYGLTRKGVPDLFTIQKYALDRFCLDAKDYK